MRVFASLVLAASLAAADYPSVTLSNDIGFEAVVYLPDQEAGYYRGTRLDHAGMVGELRYRGHTVFAPWREVHDPTAPDHGIGLAGEFDIDGPQGFAAAGKGEPFLKIGVGKLLRPSHGEHGERYFFNHSYSFAEPPVWTVESDDHNLRCTQTLSLGTQGHQYASVVSVAPDAPVVTITHHLTNTGSEPLSTEHYSHHFFIIDDQPIGTGYALTTSFIPSWEPNRQQRFAQVAALDGQTLRLTAPLEKGALYTAFAITGEVVENAFTLTGPGGVAVRYRGDRAPTRWALYAERTAICPEPFVQISVEPGETAIWVRRYEVVVPD